MAMVLAKHNAITDWRVLLGPTNTFKARDVAPNRSDCEDCCAHTMIK